MLHHFIFSQVLPQPGRPTGTRRNNNVIMTSKRRRNVVFDVIMTLFLRRVSTGRGQINPIIMYSAAADTGQTETSTNPDWISLPRTDLVLVYLLSSTSIRSHSYDISTHFFSEKSYFQKNISQWFVSIHLTEANQHASDKSWASLF